MIATATSIAHGAAMTNYATKHNRADIVLTRNLDEGLTPLAMWGAMEVVHQKYAPKFRRKPVTKPTFRMEVSPSLDETKEWTLNDWHQYAIRFLEELEGAVQTKGKNKDGTRLNLKRAQLFACLHHDAKSGIPHLHFIINRIDLDGNLINDSFIGERATRVAHVINVERGWKLPEDIHEDHLLEITNACYDILRGMSRYDWNIYKRGLESRGYKVEAHPDKNGIIHGYTVLRGNSRFKSSTLGKGRNLMPSKLEGTWKNLNPVAARVDEPKQIVASPQPLGRMSLVERYAQQQNAAQTAHQEPSTFSCILSFDGYDYPVKMSMDTYKAMDEAVEIPNESVTHEDVMNVAMLLFMNYLDATAAMSESCGGGGSTGSGWGKDKDDDDREWARRCAQKASWLSKPFGRKRGVGH